MNFIGVFGKNILFKNIVDEKLNVININEENIEHIKNVRFQIIIINDDLNKYKKLKEPLGIILQNSEYVIINSDLDIKIDISDSIKKKIITCGLNQKATVTASSITDENVLIDLQREIVTLKNKTIEPGEKLTKTYGNKDIYSILINYAINTIL